MASKEDTQILEALSLKVFGKKHEWRKLRSQGVKFANPQGGPPRRMPLTEKGAKDYMIKTLEMRQKMEEAQNANRAAGNSDREQG